MLCKVIATPAKVGTGMWKGWNFTPDDGRALQPGELRITYNPRMRESIESMLKQAKKDYKADIHAYWVQHKASKASLEMTARMRAVYAEHEKFLRAGRDLKHPRL